jgi:hypothetical protein
LSLIRDIQEFEIFKKNLTKQLKKHTPVKTARKAYFATSISIEYLNLVLKEGKLPTDPRDKKPYYKIELDFYGLESPHKHFSWGGRTLKEILINSKKDLELYLEGR